MPGVFHQSVDRIVEDARAVADLGIPAQPRFALPHAKDWLGSQAWAVAGRDCRHLPVRITTHGHCGIPGPDDQPGFIDHDRSLELIARTAVAQVEAGADPVWRPTRVPDGPRQRAASCISRQRRVLNSQSGSPTRLAGREAGRAGSADLNRSRRRRLDHHLLRQRRRALDTSNLLPIRSARLGTRCADGRLLDYASSSGETADVSPPGAW